MNNNTVLRTNPTCLLLAAAIVIGVEQNRGIGEVGESNPIAVEVKHQRVGWQPAAQIVGAGVEQASCQSVSQAGAAVGAGEEIGGQPQSEAEVARSQAVGDQVICDCPQASAGIDITKQATKGVIAS